MIDNQHHWPKKGEHLFRSDLRDHNNACLNFIKDQFDLYAVGYKRAADLLVEHAIITHSNQDTLVYPIVFLYRHYLELRMKDIIKDGNLLLDSPESYPKGHNISKLWEKCKVIIKKLNGSNGIMDEIKAVDENITEFSKIDPKSMAFRYPTDREDKPSLPGIKYINLGNLISVMMNIANFLDATCMMLCVELDFKEGGEKLYKEFNEEIEAEFNSNFYIDEW